MHLSKDPDYLEAMKYLSLSEYDKSREKFEQCLANAENGMWAALFHRAIADCFIGKGDIQGAAIAFDEACQIDPSPLSLVKRAEYSCRHLSDKTAALLDFRAALEKGKDFRDEGFSYTKFERQTRKRILVLGIEPGED